MNVTCCYKNLVSIINVDTSYNRVITLTKEMNLLKGSSTNNNNNNRNLIDVIVTKDTYSLSSILLDDT